MKEEEKEKKEKKKRLIIILLLWIIVLALGAAVFLLLWEKKSESADYAPRRLDPAVVRVEDTGEKLDAPEDGGAVSLNYSTDVEVNMETGKAAVLFENPSKSTKDMVLQLLVAGKKEGEEAVIAQSELIPAGYRLSELKLQEGVQFASGTYEGTFKVMYYDSQSREKAVVNTEIPVKIIVNNGK